MGNLVVTRRVDQVVCIGNAIRIMVVGIRGDKVRLRISAPDEITILREELAAPNELHPKQSKLYNTVEPRNGHAYLHLGGGLYTTDSMPDLNNKLIVRTWPFRIDNGFWLCVILFEAAQLGVPLDILESRRSEWSVEEKQVPHVAKDLYFDVHLSGLAYVAQKQGYEGSGRTPLEAMANLLRYRPAIQVYEP